VGCVRQHAPPRNLCGSRCSGSNATHADASCARVARGLDSVRFVTCSDRARTRARQSRHAPRSREDPTYAVPLPARTAQGHDLGSFITRWDRTKARSVRLRHVFGSRESPTRAVPSHIRTGIGAIHPIASRVRITLGFDPVLPRYLWCLGRRLTARRRQEPRWPSPPGLRSPLATSRSWPANWLPRQEIARTALAFAAALAAA